MKDEQCIDCKFYDPLFDEMGSCKRYPPQRHWKAEYESIEDECDMTAFPLVNERCWCGEWVSE